MLAALLSGIAELIGHPAYRGCPFLNLVTELSDPGHPGRVVAAGNKEEMRKRLAAITPSSASRIPAVSRPRWPCSSTAQ